VESKSFIHSHSGFQGVNEDVQSHLFRLSHTTLYQCSSNSLALILRMNSQIV
jgi:hypothetical protein